MNPARAMIWKEVRENLKWATLGMLGMTVALSWVLWVHRARGGPSEGYAMSGTPLLTQHFQAVTIVGAGLIGLLIAVAQVLPEKRLDRWAFLVHRPISRAQLLRYKVVAGLGLYALAVVVPVGLAIGWVATPKHVPAPFMPGMALPALVDLMMGVAYYFAGLVIAMREVRWYGSRIFAAGVAVSASFTSFFIPSFGWAIVPVLVAIAVLATAAWGCFLTGGHYASQPWPAKVSLGFTLFSGIVLLGGAGVVAVAESLRWQSGIYDRTHYTLLGDGRIARIRQVGQDFVSATDLAGNDLPEALLNARHEHENAFTDIGLSFGERDYYRWHENWYRSESRFFERLGHPNWYYLREKAYGVGYDANKLHLIGTFGPDGYSVPPDISAPARRFEGRRVQGESYFGYHSSSPGTALGFSSGLYELDFNRWKVIPRFIPPSGERLVSFGPGEQDGDYAHRTGRGVKPTIAAFSTETHLTVHDSAGKPLFTVPFEHSLTDGYQGVRVARRGEPARYFLWYTAGYLPGTLTQRPSQLVELSPDGTVVARQDLPSIEHKFAPNPVQPQELLTHAVTPPLGTAWTYWRWWSYSGRAMFREMLTDARSRARILATVLGGLVSAAVTVLLLSRQGASRRRRNAWAVTNFLLGPAGVLTMLCLSPWPVFEPCPGCGRRRAVDRELCPKCAAPFTPAPLDGTEIFAT